jgi:hypothetical protein
MSDEKITSQREHIRWLERVRKEDATMFKAALRARDERIRELSTRLDNANATIHYRDERIAELEGVVKAFLKEHDDTYDGGPISSGQVEAVELARTALEPRP